MGANPDQALALTRAIRSSPGYAKLAPAERTALDRDLARIDSALGRSGNGITDDPYAVSLETPADLAGPGFGPPPASSQQPGPPPEQQQPPPPPPRPPGTEVIGARARAALEAVDFPAFVAGLITGTFQAIVDATTQQVREYAQLVASIAQSVDAFSRGNVSPNQVRDWFVQRYPQDLVLSLPKAGEAGSPRLLPRRVDQSPAWLAEYGLGGQELTVELTEGALLDAGRTSLGEERMQTLATMVLMGVNRIVVSDGQIKAKLQFHASAKETATVDVAAQSAAVQQGAIAARQMQQQSAVSTMVSTVSVNAQADVSVRANLTGEVAIRFRTETFNLERFADSQAIDLITHHSRMKQQPVPAAPAAAPAAAPSSPQGAP